MEIAAPGPDMVRLRMRKILTILTLSASWVASLTASVSVPWLVSWVSTVPLTAVAAFYTAAGAAHAQTQVRFLPPNGKRGKTGEPQQMPGVKISGKLYALAPGGLIFDTNNRTILQQSLPQDADVWYQFDNNGQVARIYILRPEEQARLK